MNLLLSSLAKIASDFDTIGCVDTLHSRLPQNAMCATVNTRMTGTNWMKKLCQNCLTSLRLTTKLKDTSICPIEQKFSQKSQLFPIVNQKRSQKKVGFY